MSKKLLIFTAGALLVTAGFSQMAKAQEEAYTAMATTNRDTGAKQIQFDFRITKWANQDQIKELGAVLKDKGQDALLEELKKLDSGRINQKGETGNQIAIAEKWQDGNDTVITLIAARRMSMFETKSRGVSTKYPFGFLQVRVNASGEGSGKLVAAAAIKYDQEKGTYRLDPYGNGATPIANVRPLK
jgi:methionyl-tRNA formyltransferase